MLGAVLLASAAILLGNLNAAVPSSPARDPVTRDALARAKAALIAWAATHPDTPGLLPFPDRNDDAPADYNGESDCVAPGAIVSTDLLGRFPSQGEQGGCSTAIAMDVPAVDSSGEPLWYAVSRNLVRGGGGGPINPDIGDLALQPWITVLDKNGNPISTRVAAVIIAPGPALGAQDRSGVAPAAGNYLDTLAVGAATYDNGDADGCPDAAGCGTPGEEFIVDDNPPPGAQFNDRLVFITVDELLQAVQDRALGEAAKALRSYRNSSAAPNDYYPWMAPFTQPRLSQGTATGGTATTLVDATANFTAAGLSDGDLVRNVSDGSIGRIATGGVTANTLTLEGLIGGTTNAFAANNVYVAHAANKYQGLAGTVEGMLPVHFPNEIVATGFTVNWAFANTPSEFVDPSVVGGDPALRPAKAVVDSNAIVVPATQGVCKWTQSDRVDCHGWQTIAGGGAFGSDRTIEVWFDFTAAATVVPPTGGAVRRRNHTYNGNYFGPIVPVSAPDLPQVDWAVRITDDDGTPGTCLPLNTHCGWREAKPDVATTLTATISGIRYDIGVGPNQELPAWFVENNWQQFIHAAVSGANLPATAATSGSGSCITLPVPPTPPAAVDEPDYCLTIDYNGVRVRDDVEALVVGSGAELSPGLGQDRNASGAPCPASQPSFLCDYLEGPNSRDFTLDPASRNFVFGRTPWNSFEVSATFNDQVRAVPPP